MTIASPTRREFVNAGAAFLTAASYGRIQGANERVGIGFIGYGLIGKRHVLDFREQPDVNIVAFAEAHRGRLEEARAFVGGNVQGYGDFRKLLDDKGVDAVVVSTPDHWHALMTMLACAAGKDVYVEKPLTLFVREGSWMVEVARKHQRVVQVGTQQRSGRHYQRARDLIDKGHIGKVSSVRMQSTRNIMPGFGSPPDQDPPRDLDWDQWQGPAPLRRYNPNRAIYHFRWFWDTSGGQMTNLGAHALDVVHWYLGVQAPLTVSSVGGRFSLKDNGETPDTQDVLFQYPGGSTAVWSCREASRGPGPTSGLELFGPKGSLAVSRLGFTVTADVKVPPENSVPQFTGAHPVGGPVRTPPPATTEYWTEAVKDTGDARAQFKDHVRDFLDCMKSRKQPAASLEDGHRVATDCHLANISLRLGRSLRWDAEKETIIGDAEAAQMLVRPYRKPWDAELKALGVG